MIQLPFPRLGGGFVFLCAMNSIKKLDYKYLLKKKNITFPSLHTILLPRHKMLMRLIFT